MARAAIAALLVGLPLAWPALAAAPGARPAPAIRRLAAPRARATLSGGGGDPVRAGRRPPIEPLAINALASALRLAADAGDASGVVDALVTRRAHDPDTTLLPDEERLLRAWVEGTLRGRRAYEALLAEVAGAEPWLEGELGMGAESNPYVLLCRAECMLALFLLRDADGAARREVAFIDVDRLDALRRAGQGGA